MRKMLKKIFSRAKKKEVQKYDAFSYTISELNGIHNANKKFIDMNFGKLLDDDFRSRKKSDTFFILGSGPSINDLTHEDFSIIQRNDSIGFNFWLVHKFTPTFFCLQHTQYGEGTLYKLLKEKHADYKATPIIVRGSLLTTDPSFCEEMHLKYLLKNDVFFLNEYPIHSKFSGDIDKLIEYLENLGFFDFSNISKFTPKFRGTLGLLISLAYQMGYKNIILCGIDMKDSSHFYDSDTYTEIRKKYDLPRPGASNILTMQDQKYSMNTVKDYIVTLADFMNKKADVKVYVASEKSVLSESIPVWKR